MPGDAFVEFLRDNFDLLRQATAKRRGQLFHQGEWCPDDGNAARGAALTDLGCHDCLEALEELVMRLFNRHAAIGAGTPAAYARKTVSNEFTDMIRDRAKAQGMATKPNIDWRNSSHLKEALSPVQLELLVKMAYFARGEDALIDGRWPYDRWAADHEIRAAYPEGLTLDEVAERIKQDVECYIPAAVQGINDKRWRENFETNISAPYLEKQRRALAPDEYVWETIGAASDMAGDPYFGDTAGPGDLPAGVAAPGGAEPGWFGQLVETAARRALDEGLEPAVAVASTILDAGDDGPWPQVLPGLGFDPTQPPAPKKVAARLLKQAPGLVEEVATAMEQLNST